MKRTIIITMSLILAGAAVCALDTFKGIDLKSAYYAGIVSYSVYLAANEKKKKHQKATA